MRVFGSRRVDSLGRPDEQASINVATGFFISREGHVMTIAAVEEEASSLWIEYQGKTYPAESVGRDPHTNISLLKLTVLPSEFNFVHLVQHNDLPELGTFLVGITSKLGLEPGPVSGMVAGWHTAFFDNVLPTTYLRTSIPSDGGEGGSPIYDLNGRFVGLMVSTIPEIRSSFVVPARAVMRVRDDLIFSGRVKYGYLGIDINNEASRLDSHPLVIGVVVPGSPAEAAGVLPGDRLLEFNNTEIKHLSDLHNATFFAKPGEYLTLKLLRKGQPRELSVRVAQKPEEELGKTKPQLAVTQVKD